MRMLDLFCGRLGWSKAFLARGWECVGVDLLEPPEIPQRFSFMRSDVSTWVINDQCNWFRFISAERQVWWTLAVSDFDFICASPPCQQFSVYAMKHFHPNPPYPDSGINLFNHTRALCEASGVPYVIENVKTAQPFIGNAAGRCGPFYLWGNAVPPLVPQGIVKGIRGPSGRFWRKVQSGEWTVAKLRAERRKFAKEKPDANAAKAAEIPPELANCVADFAERILEHAEP